MISIHRGMSMIVCVTVVHKNVCYDCGELSSRSCAILAFINFSIILEVSGPQNKGPQSENVFRLCSQRCLHSASNHKNNVVYIPSQKGQK